jgi:hypothetical protein
VNFLYSHIVEFIAKRKSHKQKHQQHQKAATATVKGRVLQQHYALLQYCYAEVLRPFSGSEKSLTGRSGSR